MSEIPEELKAIHKRVLKGFAYVDDIKQFGEEEHWQFPKDVDDFEGDCDDFAIACRLLIKAETDYSTRLVACQTETSEWHLVATAEHWVLDNRQRSVKTKRQLERKGYEFRYTSGLNPGDGWKQLKD